MRKFEITFVFAALVIVALLGYGIAGNFLFSGKSACEAECKNIATLTADACVFNNTYFKKDFFTKNVCPPDQTAECEQQFCGVASYVDEEKFNSCSKLCR